MKLIPSDAGDATRTGSQAPSLCCWHWGIRHPWEKQQTGLPLCPGEGVGQRGPRSCAQLGPGGGGAGEVTGAGQMLVQLLSRGDRWDKRSRAL